MHIQVLEVYMLYKTLFTRSSLENDLSPEQFEIIRLR